jgi:hypothetical protein
MPSDVLFLDPLHTCEANRKYAYVAIGMTMHLLKPAENTNATGASILFLHHEYIRSMMEPQALIFLEASNRYEALILASPLKAQYSVKEKERMTGSKGHVDHSPRDAMITVKWKRRRRRGLALARSRRRGQSAGNGASGE